MSGVIQTLRHPTGEETSNVSDGVTAHSKPPVNTSANQSVAMASGTMVRFDMIPNHRYLPTSLFSAFELHNICSDRCDNVKMSLAMRFRWTDSTLTSATKKHAEYAERLMSFGILWCPEDRPWQGHIGQEANSWGVIHKQMGVAARDDPSSSASSCSSLIGAKGLHFFSIDPIRIGRHLEESDELRMDVNFKMSSATLAVNNVILHEFPLMVSVTENDSSRSNVVIEDFIMGCICPEDLEVHSLTCRI